MIFGLPPILGLAPLVLYVILAFKEKMNPIINVLVCVLIGAIMTGQNLGSLGGVISASMGSFLALVGFIIMLGSGLGMVLRKSGVAKCIVQLLMDKIGVKTQQRAILATMVTSIVLVTALGTMAGANAIIAPIVIPLVAAIGITPSTLAVVFMGAGQTGLFLSPFSPPMVTLMGITGLTYPQVLLSAGLPVAVVMWIGTYFVARKVQKDTEGTETFSAEKLAGDQDNSEITPQAKKATFAFALTMAALIAYGIYAQGGSSFVILVMLVAAFVTGIVAKMGLGEIMDSMMEGCAKLFWLFFMFVLFEPFLQFVTESGAFDALVQIVEPLVTSAGKLGFSLITAGIGVFGINGAAVAQAMMMDSMFSGFLPDVGVSMQLWALIVMVGHQITSYAYPGADMLGQMGLANATNIKPMMRLAYTAIIPGTMLLVAVASFVL